MFIKFFLYKEKYLEFLFVIPFPIFGFWNATETERKHTENKK
jgi:hypothetical protein